MDTVLNLNGLLHMARDVVLGQRHPGVGNAVQELVLAAFGIPLIFNVNKLRFVSA
jgi:hypothetical protein